MKNLLKQAPTRPGAYAVAVVVFAGAVAIRGSFSPVFGYSVPFITFFPAVMFSAYYGGLGPGLLATALSGLAGQLFFFEPAFSFHFRTWNDALSTLLFLMVCSFISLLAGSQRRALLDSRANQELAEQTQRKLMEEARERMEAERREARTRRWARHALSSIGDAVICTDVEGNIEFLNPVAERLTGWKNAAAAGKPLTEVFVILNEQTREPALNPIMRILQEGVVVGLANHTVLIAQNGEEHPIDDSGAPIRDEERQIIGAVLVFRDITDRKKADQRLENTIALLTRSNEDLADYAHIVSHDLQEPLRAIRTFSELLSLEYADRLGNEATQYLNFVIGGSDRLFRMICGLLTYSRVIRAEHVTKAMVRMREAVSWAEANLQQLISARNATVRCDDLPMVLANEIQLVQLFQNLIENAVKYTPKDRIPLVEVSCRENAAEWQVRVRDNGSGIDPCDQERIFALFNRAAGTESGWGVGLAICKRIAERHGGKIWVEPVAGVGSCFCFTISKTVNAGSIIGK